MLATTGALNMQCSRSEISFATALVGGLIGTTMGLTLGFAVADHWPQACNCAEALTESVSKTSIVEASADVLFSNEESFRKFWDLTYKVPTDRENILDCEQVKHNELLTLACNVYWEARGESLEGQIAVATVTRNRVLSDQFPATYSSVVWQRRGRIPQFEWTFDGRSDIVRDRNSWVRALAVAALVKYHVAPDVTNGAQFYHAVGLHEDATRWFRTRLVLDSEIGNHVFYLASI